MGNTLNLSLRIFILFAVNSNQDIDLELKVNIWFSDNIREIEIVITPGIMIDLYPFEVSQYERLKIDIAQTCFVNKDFFEQIKSGIGAFLGPYTVEIK